MTHRRSRPEALVGTELGERYKLIQHLGSGGMAHVYLAERLAGARAERIAIKLLRIEHLESPGLVARFERESAAASRIRHPNVLRADKLERTFEGLTFFAMELLVGLDLADTLAFVRRLAPVRAVRIAVSVAGALAAAHEIGIVHRDVKPENLFLVHAPDGREIVRLLDFGFAWMRGDGAASAERRITRGAAVVGTPEYMAPEQARGAPPEPAADVYSLGIVLFETLTGRVPFTGEYPAIADRHGEEPVPELEAIYPGLVVSDELRSVIQLCLAKDPARRFVDGAALRGALSETPEGRESDA